MSYDTAKHGNPFADKTANQTGQMLLIRADPAEARRLITAAGKEPRDFGWSGEATPIDKNGVPYHPGGVGVF
jgi:hypothetical protein